MQQLQFMKEMIVDKLNQRLACDAVKNIFFMVGRINTAEAESATEAVQNSPHAGADIEVNEELLASIGDPAIRAAFKKLLKSYARRKPKT
jgi:predicted lysophospholipase L1 biosynthesis ABC-type transport system permease subunit